MAYFSGSRTLMTFASKARSAAHCCRNTSLACEMAVGSATRSMPCATPSSSTPLLANRRLSFNFMRLPKEVACAQSLLPLYSVTASSRLVSQLSTNAAPTTANLHDLSSLKPR